MKCLNDRNPVHARGLCRRCFNYAAIRVKRGEWNWLDLEARGLAKPRTKPGRKPPEWTKRI